MVLGHNISILLRMRHKQKKVWSFFIMEIYPKHKTYTHCIVIEVGCEQLVRWYARIQWPVISIKSTWLCSETQVRVIEPPKRISVSAHPRNPNMIKHVTIKMAITHWAGSSGLGGFSFFWKWRFAFLGHPNIEIKTYKNCAGINVIDCVSSDFPEKWQDLTASTCHYLLVHLYQLAAKEMCFWSRCRILDSFWPIFVHLSCRRDGANRIGNIVWQGCLRRQFGSQNVSCSQMYYVQ